MNEVSGILFIAGHRELLHLGPVINPILMATAPISSHQTSSKRTGSVNSRQVVERCSVVKSTEVTG